MWQRPKHKSGLPTGKNEHSTIAEVSRFTIVGLLASLTYLVASNILFAMGQISPAVSSIGAYFLGMIVSFIGQSYFTFRVGRTSFAHLYKFTALSVLGLTFSYLSVVIIVDNMGLHAFWASIATVLVVPIMSYVIMKAWVFASGKSGSP